MNNKGLLSMNWKNLWSSLGSV